MTIMMYQQEEQKQHPKQGLVGEEEEVLGGYRGYTGTTTTSTAAVGRSTTASTRRALTTRRAISTSTMPFIHTKWVSLLSIILLLSIPPVTWAQYDNFQAATVPCPSDSSITGYDNIAAVNSDMDQELDRIRGGGTPQANGYFVVLCPQTTFEIGSDTLRPSLDLLTISCGTSGAQNQNCTFTGGSQHVQVLDSDVAGYTLNSINIVGVTFTNFGGTAFSARASAPTEVTLLNCVWQDFSTTQLFAIRADNPMTVNVEASTIRSSTGDPNGATAQSVFRNEGGVVTTNGLAIENVNIGNIVQIEQNGASFMTDTSITGSIITSVVNMNSGIVEIETMNVANNQQLRDVFLVSNAGAELSLNNTSVSNNQQDSSFTVLDVSGGASATMKNSVIENNGKLENAVIINSNSNGVIVDTDFIGNAGTDNTPLVVSSESGANLDLARVEFVGNTGGLANLGAMFGGNIAFRQTCFRENNNLIVVLVLEGSNYQAENNFVENESEISILCGGRDEVEGPNRLSVEIPGSLCFRGGQECLVTCEEETNDVDSCMADEMLSVIPTTSPSTSPRPSGQSAVPTIILSPGCAGANNTCIEQNRNCTDGADGSAVCGDCLAGFIEDTSGICQDIDECLDSLNDCALANRTCVNSVGSFECQDCLPGLEESAGGECVDVDECALFPNNSCTTTNRVCVNIPGGFECGDCLEGFIEDNGVCVPENPEDPCLQPANECDLLFRLCQSGNGTVTCGECIPGREEVNGFCQPTDPCANNVTDTCAIEFRVCGSINGVINCGECIDGFQEVDGVCQPFDPCADPVTNTCAVEFRVCASANDVITCGACLDGYEEVNGVCQPIETCDNPVNSCATGFRVCLTSDGSIECGDCIDGYVESEAGICEPTDPCLVEGNECALSFRSCSSEGGIVSCGPCIAGYVEENGICVAQDPCLENGNSCTQSNRICVPGSEGDFSCGDCLPSYEEVNGECQISDICGNDPENACALSNRVCIPVPGEPGSIQCGSCLEGFEEDDTGICIPGGACQISENSSSCSSENRVCESLPDGGFQCGPCLVGFKEDSKGDCISSDACLNEENANQCSARYRTCDTLPNGEFRCGVCLPGFQDNGMDCIDINECLIPLNVCALQSRYCFNLIGTFECANCVDGYANVDGVCVLVDFPTPVPTIQQNNRPTPQATLTPTRSSGGLWPLPFEFNLIPTRPRPPPVEPPSHRPPPRPTPKPPSGRPPVHIPPFYFPTYEGKGKGKGGTGGSYKSKMDKDYNKIVIGKGKGSSKGGSSDDSGDYHFGIGYVQPRNPGVNRKGNGEGTSTKWYGRRFGGEEAADN